MKWRNGALILFLFLSGLCWGQASESDFTDQPLSQSEQSETNSGLLWQSGASALDSSILSFEALGTKLRLIEDWTKRSLELSEKAWQLSVQLELTTNAAFNSFISLETSSTSLESATTQITKHLANLQAEAWIWRITTFCFAGLSLYLFLQ
jgi:hypothetical protein